MKYSKLRKKYFILSAQCKVLIETFFSENMILRNLTTIRSGNHRISTNLIHSSRALFSTFPSKSAVGNRSESSSILDQENRPVDIAKNLWNYVWPKHDNSIKVRVIGSLALLISGKV